MRNKSFEQYILDATKELLPKDKSRLEQLAELYGNNKISAAVAEMEVKYSGQTLS